MKVSSQAWTIPPPDALASSCMTFNTTTDQRTSTRMFRANLVCCVSHIWCLAHPGYHCLVDSLACSFFLFSWDKSRFCPLVVVSIEAVKSKAKETGLSHSTEHTSNYQRRADQSRSRRPDCTVKLLSQMVLKPTLWTFLSLCSEVSDESYRAPVQIREKNTPVEFSCHEETCGSGLSQECKTGEVPRVSWNIDVAELSH